MNEKFGTDEDVSRVLKYAVSAFTKSINGITPEDYLINLFNTYSYLTGNEKDNNEKYPLLYACQYDIYNSFAILLIEKYPNAISETIWTAKRNPIHVIIDTGRIDIMPLVLEHSNSFINDNTIKPSQTPLQYIICKEDDENFDKYAFIQLFLNNSNVMVNATHLKKETALYAACKIKDVRAIELLFLRSDLDPTQYTYLHTSAFLKLFHMNDGTAMTALDGIEMVDYENNEHYHDIMSRDTLMILLKMFVRRFPNILDKISLNSSENALHYSIIHRCYYVIPFLLSMMGPESINNINEEDETPLHRACEKDQSLMVTKFLLCQPQILINEKNCLGQTPFHSACWQKSISNIQYLIDYPGIDINTVNFQGNTTLHSAISDFHIHWRNGDIVRVDIPLIIELLLGTDTNICMNMKILKKNKIGNSSYDNMLIYSKLSQNEDQDSEMNNDQLTDRLLKVQHWKVVKICFDFYLEKGRFDFYEFLIKYYIGNNKKIDN